MKYKLKFTKYIAIAAATFVGCEFTAYAANPPVNPRYAMFNQQEVILVADLAIGRIHDIRPEGIGGRLDGVMLAVPHLNHPTFEPQIIDWAEALYNIAPAKTRAILLSEIHGIDPNYDEEYLPLPQQQQVNAPQPAHAQAPQQARQPQAAPAVQVVGNQQARQEMRQGAGPNARQENNNANVQLQGVQAQAGRVQNAQGQDIQEPVAANVAQVSSVKQIIHRVGDNIIANPEKAVKMAETKDQIGANMSETRTTDSVTDEVVANKSPQEQALLFVTSVQQLPTETRKELLNVVAKQYTEIIDIDEIALQAVEGNISSRLDNVNLGNVSAVPVGVSSGDDERKIVHGVWVSGLYGASKNSKKGSAYDGKVFGPTIGVDFNLGDEVIIGAAYSYALSNFKYKNKYEQKIDAKSHVFSLYSQAQISDNILWNNLLSFSTTGVTRKSSRPITANINKQSTGKFNSKAYSLETILGYSLPVADKLSLVPNAGLRVGKYESEAYTEKGLGVQNVHVDSSSNTAVTGIIGVKALWRQQITLDTAVNPAINLSIENYFNNKEKKAKAKFVWMGDYFQSEAGTHKAAKIGYNLGASLLTTSNNIELLAAYNCHLRTKYQSHQGYIRLKLLF